MSDPNWSFITSTAAAIPRASTSVVGAPAVGVTLRLASDLMSAAGTFPTQLFWSSAGL